MHLNFIIICSANYAKTKSYSKRVQIFKVSFLTKCIARLFLLSLRIFNDICKVMQISSELSLFIFFFLLKYPSNYHRECPKFHVRKRCFHKGTWGRRYHGDLLISAKLMNWEKFPSPGWKKGSKSSIVQCLNRKGLFCNNWQRVVIWIK